MTGGAITTERLTLRPLRTADAAAVTDGIARWEVIRWLTTPPWPYALEHALEFIDSELSRGALGITLAADDRVRGIVHLNASLDLGYWLHPEVHGRGWMTEAATAVVGRHFAGSDQPLESGHLTGNAASAGVLRKLGFRSTASKQCHSNSHGGEVAVERMILTPADWEGRPRGN